MSSTSTRSSTTTSRCSCSARRWRWRAPSRGRGRHVRRGRPVRGAHAPRLTVSRWNALGLARGGRGVCELRADVMHIRLGVQARVGGRAGPRRRVLRVDGVDVVASGDVGRRRRGRARRGICPALVADPGAPAGRETGAHRGPGMSGVGRRPEACLQATRKISGAPRFDKSPLVMCPPPPARSTLGVGLTTTNPRGRAVPGRLHARVGGARGRYLATLILWSLVAYKLLGPSAQPLLGAAKPWE